MEVVGLEDLERVLWIGGLVDGVDPDAAVGGAESEDVGVGGVGAGEEEVDFGDFLGGGKEGVGCWWRGCCGVYLQPTVETAGQEVGAGGEGVGEGVYAVAVAGEFGDRLDGGARGRRWVRFVGGREDRTGDVGVEDVGCVVAAACCYCRRMDRVIGDAEYGVGMVVKVCDRVVLELDLLLSVFIVTIIVQVHWVIWIVGHDLCCFRGVEKRFIIRRHKPSIVIVIIIVLGCHYKMLRRHAVVLGRWNRYSGCEEPLFHSWSDLDEKFPDTGMAISIIAQQSGLPMRLEGSPKFILQYY